MDLWVVMVRHVTCGTSVPGMSHEKMRIIFMFCDGANPIGISRMMMMMMVVMMMMVMMMMVVVMMMVVMMMLLLLLLLLSSSSSCAFKTNVSKRLHEEIKQHRNMEGLLQIIHDLQSVSLVEANGSSTKD